MPAHSQSTVPDGVFVVLRMFEGMIALFEQGYGGTMAQLAAHQARG